MDRHVLACSEWCVFCAVTSVLSASTPLQCPLSIPKHQNKFLILQTMELMQKLLTSFLSTLMVPLQQSSQRISGCSCVAAEEDAAALTCTLSTSFLLLGVPASSQPLPKLHVTVPPPYFI